MNISRRIRRHNEEIFRLATRVEICEKQGNQPLADHWKHRMRLHQLALLKLENPNDFKSEAKENV